MNKVFDYSDKYVTLEDGEHLYGDVDLTTQKIVEARYVKSKIKYDNGNMMIEALPCPRDSEQEIFRAYNRDIGIFSEEEKDEMKNYEKMSAVNLLRQLRLPLPFHKSLETVTYLSLLNSYRNRRPIIATMIYPDNENGDFPSVRLKGNQASATSGGFSLLGYSGCGKSSALEILFSNYPQTIIHRFDNGIKITQIVYLTVNCIGNSNFSGLYAAIGEAIDDALEYTEPIYKELIKKTKGLGAKASVVADLIERFSIGLIVFDEIQLINFNSTKENSVEGLMTLANKTKVAMGVVGTEDAFNLLFSKMRTGRRFGETIIGHEYCSNQDFFKFIVNSIFNYQWFDKPVTVTDELYEALYDVCKGIIDLLIGIYIFMQIDCIQAKKKPVIDAKYIKKTAEKHYPGMMRLVERLDDPVAEKRRIELIKKGNEEITQIIKAEKESQNAQAEKIMELNKTPEERDNKRLMVKIVQEIMDFTDDYDMNTVMSCTQKELSLKSNESADSITIRKKVFKRLQRLDNGSTGNKRKKTVKDLDELHINMLNEILED